MKKSFGTKFTIVNEVRQVLPTNIFRKGPWIHLATVSLGVREFMAFHRQGENFAYIEECDTSEPGIFKKIEDENLFNDLYEFLLTRGCLTISGINNEIKIAKEQI